MSFTGRDLQKRFGPEEAPKQMTDQEHAAAIREATARLNDALNDAYTAGLLLEVRTHEAREFPRPHQPRVIVTASASRPL